MNTKIHILNSSSRSRTTDSASAEFRRPNYDCREQPDAVKLVVYVPGVDSSGVEITASGPDLMVMARKTRYVRVNFESLHLENAMRDYRLTLRLGNGLDFASLRAEISDGILTIILPKRNMMDETSRLRRAA
jgi:HSP20 family protein